MDGIAGRLQLDVDDEEEDFGFSVAEESSGIRAVVRELRPGLLAVKVRASDGTTEYAVCTEDLHPLYPAAKTLDELRNRFLRSP